MSEIVLGLAASHSTLMNTHWDEVDHLPAAHRFRAGLGEAHELLKAARPDTVIIIGSNHFRGMFLDLMPAITIGVAEVTGAGESGTPGHRLPIDEQLAKHIVDDLVSNDVDLAFSLRLIVDHGVTHSIQYLIDTMDIPIVPVVMNMFAPPLMSLRRAHGIGRLLGDAIRTDGKNKRVAIIASGGLSHRLPWPDWAAAISDDDRFLVEAWLSGRDQWKEFEARRRAIIRAAQPELNPEFDRDFLRKFEAGDLETIISMTTAELEELGGNGSQEIRAWIAMAAAVGPAKGKTLAYEPISAWLTGMGVAALHPNAAAAAFAGKDSEMSK